MQAVISPGTYLKGTDDDGNLINYNLLGREVELNLSDFQNRTAGMKPKTRQFEGKVCARIVRNVSGGVLVASRVAQFDLSTEPSRDASDDTILLTSGTAGVPMMTTVAKESDGAGLKFCGVVDPSLKEDVPDDAIFLLITKGVTLARMTVAGSELVPGSIIVSAAAGRIELRAAEAVDTYLATSLETRTVAANAGELALVNWCPTVQLA